MTTFNARPSSHGGGGCPRGSTKTADLCLRHADAWVSVAALMQQNVSIEVNKTMLQLHAKSSYGGYSLVVQCKIPGTKK